MLSDTLYRIPRQTGISLMQRRGPGQSRELTSRRLVLDYGLRFYHDLPQAEVRGQTAAFVQGLYNAQNAPVLITSGRDAKGNRIGIDPVTGAQFNVAFIGTFAPGHGNSARASALPMT